METIDRVADLMLTIEEFSELLDEETIAIRAVNPKAVATLLPRKQYLATHYTRQIAFLADHKADVATLDDSVKSMLQEACLRFDQKKTENMRALEVAQRATRQVVDIIVDAIRQVRNGPARGGAYKRSAEAGTATASSCVSISINKVL